MHNQDLVISFFLFETLKQELEPMDVSSFPVQTSTMKIKQGIALQVPKRYLKQEKVMVKVMAQLLQLVAH